MPPLAIPQTPSSKVALPTPSYSTPSSDSFTPWKRTKEFIRRCSPKVVSPRIKRRLEIGFALITSIQKANHSDPGLRPIFKGLNQEGVFKSSRLSKKFKTQLDVSQNFASDVHIKRYHNKKKTRSDTISAETKKLVINFYLRDDNSRQMPGALCVSMRTMLPETEATHQRCFLMTLFLPFLHKRLCPPQANSLSHQQASSLSNQQANSLFHQQANSLYHQVSTSQSSRPRGSQESTARLTPSGHVSKKKIVKVHERQMADCIYNVKDKFLAGISKLSY